MKKIGIWGTGCMSLGLSNAFDKNEADIIFYVDNDKEKQGTIYNGVKIISPQELAVSDFDLLFISTQKYEEDIKEQIKELGIDKTKVISATIKNYEKKTGKKLEI